MCVHPEVQIELNIYIYSTTDFHNLLCSSPIDHDRNLTCRTIRKQRFLKIYCDRHWPFHVHCHEQRAIWITNMFYCVSTTLAERKLIHKAVQKPWIAWNMCRNCKIVKTVSAHVSGLISKELYNSVERLLLLRTSCIPNQNDGYADICKWDNFKVCFYTMHAFFVFLFIRVVYATIIIVLLLIIKNKMGFAPNNSLILAKTQ